MAFSDVPSASPNRARRTRVPCRLCQEPIDIGRLREHFRSDHHLDSSNVEGEFLTAVRDARRTRRVRA